MQSIDSTQSCNSGISFLLYVQKKNVLQRHSYLLYCIPIRAICAIPLNVIGMLILSVPHRRVAEHLHCPIVAGTSTSSKICWLYLRKRRYLGHVQHIVLVVHAQHVLMFSTNLHVVSQVCVAFKFIRCRQIGNYVAVPSTRTTLTYKIKALTEWERQRERESEISCRRRDECFWWKAENQQNTRYTYDHFINILNEHFDSAKLFQ